MTPSPAPSLLNEPEVDPEAKPADAPKAPEAYADFTLPGLSPESVAAEFSRATGETMTAGEAASLLGKALNGGITPFIKDLGASGNQSSKEVFCYPQLQLKGRKFHGKLVLS